MNTNLALTIDEDNPVIETQEDHNLNSFGYHRIINFQLQNQYQIFASLYLNTEHPKIPYILQITAPSIFNFATKPQILNEYFSIQVDSYNEVTQVNRVLVHCDNTNCNLEVGEELIYSSLIGEQIPVIF